MFVSRSLSGSAIFLKHWVKNLNLDDLCEKHEFDETLVIAAALSRKCYSRYLNCLLLLIQKSSWTIDVYSIRFDLKFSIVIENFYKYFKQASQYSLSKHPPRLGLDSIPRLEPLRLPFNENPSRQKTFQSAPSSRWKLVNQSRPKEECCALFQRKKHAFSSSIFPSIFLWVINQRLDNLINLSSPIFSFLLNEAIQKMNQKMKIESIFFLFFC